MSNELQNLLNNLELLSNEAVFFFDEREKWNSLVSSETKKKIEQICPTAFYIFNKVPYILFFDLTNTTDLENEQTIHKQVWSFDQAQLAFIIKNNEIKIYNAFAYAKRIKSLQEIELKEGQSIQDIFSFWKLQSGFTWKWLQDNHYKNNIHNKRVNQRLFENIKLVREELIKSSINNKLTEDDVNILILRLIFIRYLIDRDVQLNEEFIRGKTILEKRKSFSDLIESPDNLNHFFEILNVKFNGVLFKDTDNLLSKEQSLALSLVFKGEKPEIGDLFFDGDFYFEIFDFSIIPVEVISGIYESLIEPETRKLHSAVYTPSFLVEYMLSKTIDKYFCKKENSIKTECKIFDPSMGSGIFLVQSYRRMVDREQLKSNDGKISKTRLREIAQNNLFGIDINPQALKVACFSIYIAILDYQEPKTIIDNLPFPKLIGENLFDANFFDTEHSFNEIIKTNQIDFILGNPPWKNGANDLTHKEYLKTNNLLKIVSDYQLAQSFIIRSKDFSNDLTQIALIVTSKAIYNFNAKSFRSYFLKYFFLDICFDFSAVNTLIFEHAANPAMILFFKDAKGLNTRNNLVEHVSIKHNVYLKCYNTLVIEKNDLKRIKQFYFIENSWMFKVALYGGVLDYQFLKELNSNYTIKNYINDTDGLHYGDGIKLLTEYGRKKLKKESLPFNEIKNIPIIETDDISEYFTVVNPLNLPKEKDLHIKSGRDINHYKGYRILLKARPKNNTDIVYSFVLSDCIFREKTLGISTLHKVKELKILYGIISSDLYAYFQFITSSSLGIFMPEIMQKEYLQFPFKEVENKDELINTVSNFIEYFIKRTHCVLEESKNHSFENDSRESINKLINRTYLVKSYQLDLIDYVLNISRYQFKENKIKHITEFTYSDEKHYRNFILVIKNYSEIFFSEFESVYSDEFMSIEVYTLDHFIALNFVFSKEKPTERIRIESNGKDEGTVLKKIAHSASISQISKDLFIQKDIKGFEADSFYIIKPNEYKCWHRAMAWYDVAEIKQMIEADELEYLKANPDAI